jgi:hypothetical protein
LIKTDDDNLDSDYITVLEVNWIWSECMFRREFIRLATLAAGAVPFSSSTRFGVTEVHGANATNPKGKNSSPDTELLKIFQNPPNQYRPMVRWWWNGDRITAEEITRELDVLQRAGIGGVEINPIKFPAEADPLNTKALAWMSDEWIAVLKVALQDCKEKRMTCDMIVGSGGHMEASSLPGRNRPR